MRLRTYARVVAMVSVVAAVAAALGRLALGPGSVLLYLFMAGVFAYAGGRRRAPGFARVLVGSFGAFYLASGLVLSVLLAVLRFPFEGGAYAEALGLAVLGGLSAACARVLPCEDDPKEGQERSPRQD